MTFARLTHCFALGAVLFWSLSATASDDPTGRARSDAQAHVTADNMTPGVGENFTITATFDNTSTAGGGPLDVFGASMVVQFPTALSIVSVGTINFGNCSSVAGGVTCTFLSFPAGASEELAVVLVATEVGDFTVTVTVSHPDFDPDTSNNTATKEINVTQPGSICGGKYRDLDADGFLSAEEKAQNPLESWRIDLTTSGESSPSQSATTAADGTYCFTELQPGTYFLNEEARTSWVMSNPANGQRTVTLSSGQTVVDQDFANYPVGGVEILKFNDLNGDGAQDPLDLPVQGIEILLSGVSGMSSTVPTGPDGAARFESIPSGAASLFEIVGPAGGSALRGSSTGGASTIAAGTPVVIFPIEVPIGETLTFVIGNYLFGSISGRKWSDGDEDAVIDPVEQFLPGWTIELFKDGEQVGTQVTGPGGAYSFTGLAPGNYEVREVVQDGWTQTFPVQSTGSSVYTLTVLSGQDHEDINFGNLGPAADLAVVKSAPSVVTKGQFFDFVIDVSNVGELPLANVTMQDVLDAANFEFVRFSGDGICSNADGTITCLYGALDVGESRQTVIRVRAIGIGVERNTATASTDTVERNLENNTTEVEVLIEFADVAVDKTVSDATIEIDQETVFTIVVSNAGNAEADNVGMQDVVPGALEILSVVPSMGDCTVSGQTIDCAFGPLGEGETRTVTVTVKGLQEADVTNVATASTSSEEVSDLNNTDGVQVQIGLLRLSVAYVEDTCVSGPDSVDDGVSDGNVVDVTITVTNLTAETQSYQLTLSDGIRTTPVSPSLAGTVAPEGADLKTFQWRTEGLAWLGPRDPRETPFGFETTLLRGEQVVDSQRDEIRILPRPLVLVHGVLSNAATWSAYPALATAAHAFWEGRTHAVNSMDTGAFPEGELNLLTMYTETTIDDNARAVNAELEAFRRRTKSCKVDIVAHSMGGLISRSYIDSFMADDKPVANLMQLGTPNEGSSCAEPGLALSKVLFKEQNANAPYPMNFYQLTPTYLRNVFNRIRADQKGIPFHVIAGALHPVSASLGTLATVCLKPEFGDGLVSVESAWALLDGVPAFATTTQIPLNHIALTGSAAVFQQFVVPIASGGAVNAPAARSSGGSPLDSDVDLTTLTALRVGGASTESPFPVGTADAMHLTVLMDTGTQVRLLDPTGLVAATTDTLAARLSPFVSMSVSNPAPGDWTLDFSRAASDSTSVGYAIGLEGSSLSLVGQTQVDDETITISATLTGGWGAPSVSATVSGATTETQTVLTEVTPGQYETAISSTETGPHLVVITAAEGSDMRLAVATADIGVVGIGVDPVNDPAVPISSRIGAGYPNPTYSHIVFPIEMDQAQTASLRVVDVTGRVVLAYPARFLGTGRHEIEIDTSELAVGTYVLLGDIGGSVAHRQFVVMR